MNSLGSLEGKKILLLQGPMGTFFNRLDHNFRKQGAVTYRIGFNKGDQFFSSKDNYTAFKERREAGRRFYSSIFRRKKDRYSHAFW